MEPQPHPEQAIYQIHIQEHLDPHWSTWFDGLVIAYAADGTTTITGPAADQTALYGLIDKARDLGLTLLAVYRLESTPAPAGAGGRIASSGEQSSSVRD